jgi:hypothetical protein
MRSPVRASILPDRRRVTASGDPVGGVARRPPISIIGTNRTNRDVVLMSVNRCRPEVSDTRSE